MGEEPQNEGVSDGVAIGYIGLSMDAHPVRLSGARIVCEVPVHYGRDNQGIVLGRTELEAFWRQSPEQRRAVLNLMHQNGASAVVADMVPAWADTTGWKELRSRGFPVGTRHVANDSRPYIYHFAGSRAPYFTDKTRKPA